MRCIAQENDSSYELASRADLRHCHGIVNCTGIGATKLAEDSSLFLTKGHSVIVRGKACRISSMLGNGWEAVLVLDQTQ